MINWNKHQSKVSMHGQNYFDYFVHLKLQGVNRFYVLQCEINTDRTVHT